MPAERAIRMCSFDARTWETARPTLQLLREREGTMDMRRVIDQDTLEKVQCPCFVTQYLRNFDA